MRAALLLLALAVTGCNHRAPEPEPEPARTAVPATPAANGDPGRASGTVRVVGSAPINVQVVVADADGGSVQIIGPLREEIRRLRGAEVDVWGRPDQGALEVTGYEVRAVNGEPVVWGVVERAADGALQLRTPGDAVVQLGGAANRLQAGQKVWVQGPRSVQVQSYGVITP